jgi:hypothetical protein
MNRWSAETLTIFEWDILVDNSPQGTVFCKSWYLNSANIHFKPVGLFYGQELRGGLLLIQQDDSSENIILDDLVIHGGLLLKTPPGLTKAGITSSNYSTTTFAVEWLTEHYSKISLALSPELQDLRPFLWHAYHSDDPEKKFIPHLRYTSRLDISNFKINDENDSIWKEMVPLRRRNVREANKVKALFKEEPEAISQLLEFYSDLMTAQDSEVSTNKLKRMFNLMEVATQTGCATLTTSRSSEGRLLYATFWIWDQYRAYYLFGAGTSENKMRFQGTHCFWNSFDLLSNKYHIQCVDLEGINSPSRGSFKLTFGGDITPYYELCRNRF